MYGASFPEVKQHASGLGKKEADQEVNGTSGPSRKSVKGETQNEDFPVGIRESSEALT